MTRSTSDKKNGGSSKEQILKNNNKKSISWKTTLRHGCESNFVTLKKIGEGSYGQVYQACRRGSEKCEFVIKKAIVSRDIDKETADRDYYFLTLLKQAKTKDGRPVVPKIFDAWYCNNKQCEHNRAMCTVDVKKKSGRKKQRVQKGIVFVAMQKFDNNMLNLVNTRAQEKLNTFGYPYLTGLELSEPPEYYMLSELVRMYQIMYKLGTLGVVVGDVKPDQFLQNRNGKEIVLTDFGFAGTITGTPFEPENGWQSNEKISLPFKVCPSGDVQIRTKRQAVAYNLWNLESYFCGRRELEPVYVEHRGKKYIFTGLDGFAREYAQLEHQVQVCPDFLEYYEMRVDSWKQNLYNIPTLSLSWKEIVA